MTNDLEEKWKPLQIKTVKLQIANSHKMKEKPLYLKTKSRALSLSTTYNYKLSQNKIKAFQSKIK